MTSGSIIHTDLHKPNNKLVSAQLEHFWCTNEPWANTNSLTHSQLLEGFKSESKYKIVEGEGVGARSLAHNTLRGRRACWSSGMGLGRVDKLYSLTRACTQPTQGDQCIVGTPLVLRRAMGNMDTQDSPWPGLGGSHHLPPYSILCTSPRGLHPNGFSLPGLPRGSFKIALKGTLVTLEPHNFVSRPQIEVRSKAKLQPLSRYFQRYVTSPLQLSKLGRFLTFSGWGSNDQFDSSNRSLKFRESTGIPSPKLTI